MLINNKSIQNSRSCCLAEVLKYMTVSLYKEGSVERGILEDYSASLIYIIREERESVRDFCDHTFVQFYTFIIYPLVYVSTY